MALPINPASWDDLPPGTFEVVRTAMAHPRSIEIKIPDTESGEPVRQLARVTVEVDIYWPPAPLVSN